MNARLTAQLQRLYGLPGEGRALAMTFRRATDWGHVARVYRGVREDLDLPAPALSVAGDGGFALWFSLRQSAAPAEVAVFAEGLRRRYLADVPAAAFACQAVSAEAALPVVNPGNGRWSAFIDPGMGSMFVDEPGLDIEPNPERQADLLAGLDSVAPAEWTRALASLQSTAAVAGELFEAVPARLSVGGGFENPRDFLLAVMNDTAASPSLRVEAARALLPYIG